MYFLVDSLLVTGGLYSDYYSRVPNITNGKNFREILTEVQYYELPSYIEKTICNVNKQGTFDRLMKNIPEDIQEEFIEAAILAEKSNIKDSTIRNMVLAYFAGYIHEIEGKFISTKLDDTRCLYNDNDNIWKNCDEDYEKLIEKEKTIKQEELHENEWGYYGKYNPETGVFAIVDVHSEKSSMAKKSRKITDKKEELKSKDHRSIYTGKNCEKGWGVPELLKIVKNLSLDYPEDFKRGESDEKLRLLIKANKQLSKVYDNTMIESLSNDEMRRLLYYISIKGSKIVNICKKIREWFSSRNMIITDTETGTTGGHTKGVKKTDKKSEFTIIKIIPSQDPDKFENNMKDINKLFSDFTGNKKTKFILEEDEKNKKWILVFLRKKIVSLVSIDSKNIISKIYVREMFVKKGIAKEIIRFSLEEECEQGNPIINIDNHLENYTKIVEQCKTYGFKLISNNGDNTVMKLEC